MPAAMQAGNVGCLGTDSRTECATTRKGKISVKFILCRFTAT